MYARREASCLILLCPLTYELFNTYAGLISEEIFGSPEALTKTRLHARARELAAYSKFTPERGRRELEDAANRGLLITDAIAIHRAVAMGRVRELFVPVETNGDEPLVNSLAVAAIRHSSAVIGVPRAELPGGIAAILRYRSATASRENTRVASFRSLASRPVLHYLEEVLFARGTYPHPGADAPRLNVDGLARSKQFGMIALPPGTNQQPMEILCVNLKRGLNAGHHPLAVPPIYNPRATPFEWKKAVVFPTAPKLKYSNLCK